MNTPAHPQIKTDLLPSEPVRSSALDVLRGLAIFTMVLSGTIPFGVLPSWMYHAQLPPPTHKFNPLLPGLTWVDLVFPFFLFSLGAALPLALGRKLSKPGGVRTAVIDGFRRFGLLVFFAVATWHLNPVQLNGWKGSMATFTWSIGFIACLGFTLVLGRFPISWSRSFQFGLRVAGWILCGILVALVPPLYGKSFSLKNADIILVVLSNVALFGTLVMVLFQARPALRWTILGLGLILHAFRQFPPNIIQQITDLKPLGWIFGSWSVECITWAFHPRYLKYLFIVIPGMAAGDVLVRYLAQPREIEKLGLSRDLPWLGRGFLLLAFLATGLFLACHLSRHILLAAGFMVVSFAVLLWLVRYLPYGPARQALNSLLFLSVVAVGIGFALEPYQGGAKKDFATLSYYAFGSGFAALNLAGFLAVERFSKFGPFLKLLATNGANPMLAYIASAFLVQPFLRLTGLWEPLAELTRKPWLGVGRAGLIVVLGALLVAVAGRFRVFWKS